MKHDDPARGAALPRAGPSIDSSGGSEYDDGVGGAVRRAGVTDLVCIRRGALAVDIIHVLAVVDRNDDLRAIPVHVDVARAGARPAEAHLLQALHLVAARIEADARGCGDGDRL